ncbi:MAG: hypothetical protein SGPRY_012678, partial [Prymnesium sp.]
GGGMALSKLISEAAALRRWQSSPSYAELISFIRELAAAVTGRQLSSPYLCSPLLVAIVSLLDELGALVEEFPPQKVSVRYGNPAFKQWHARLVQRAPALMRSLLPEGNDNTCDELAEYWCGAFGDPMRIDYGTGHELSFTVWMFCLSKAGVLLEADYVGAVLMVFHRYILLMRKLQTTYWLEPAGSHGVWGLDDYHFLPFLFGASQLVGHTDIVPSSITDVRRLEETADEYMYMAAILFIRQVKKGPFGEHSPMLNDISNLDCWERVATGLLRMFEGEVLGKLPVVQHLKFGTFLTAF